MVKAFKPLSMQVDTISILITIGEWSLSKYFDKNQWEICSPNFWFLYYMHGHFWSLDVVHYLWHICYGYQLLRPPSELLGFERNKIREQKIKSLYFP
jgi:hypothetical protein